MSVKSLLSAIVLTLNPPAQSAQCDNCAVSDDGLQLIRTFEGFSPTPYRDAAGYPTIGYGHLITSGEQFTMLMPFEAETLLRKDAARTVKDVNRLVTPPLWQNQFDALTSFTYNLGAGRLQGSTLLKRVNANRHKEVPPEFRKWVYVGGKRLKGLEARREMEATLYSYQ